MATISTKDAAADLAGLLDRVARGEEFTILSGDKPVARIVPIATSENGRLLSREEAIDRLMVFGRGRFLGDIDIRDLIEEGRM